MKKRLKKVAILMSFVMFASMGLNVNADELSDAEEKKQALEEQKQAAEGEKDSLAATLSTTVAELQDTRIKTHEKHNEVLEKEIELEMAKITANDQYEAMKKRIKYIFEGGDLQFITLLAESKDMSDLVNKAEYVKTVSEYDREMLTKYQETVSQIETQEAELKVEHAKLEEMQAALTQRQTEFEALLASKEAELGNLDKELQDQIAHVESIKQAKEAAEAAAAAAAAESATGGGSSTGYVSGGESVVTGSGQFTHPLPGAPISSPFGWRTSPITGGSEHHNGVDYVAGSGTPVYAAADGVVTVASYHYSAGNWIHINHGNGLVSIYMHASSFVSGITPGATVTKGQHIMNVGSTGDSTGAHLHFEVRQNGVAVNPLQFL